MNLKRLSMALCWLFTPSLFAADDQKPHRYTDRDEISFTSSTEAAFDRSGHQVRHTFLPDGALLADHHGTMGNVTVARIGPDGSLETLCTTDREAAIGFMSGELAVSRETTVELNLEER